MPGKIKVKVLAGRNLPVMDRASDTTDAFVEIKFGGVTHKTDVCRKSLNPHWNSTEWYRFEVDESELQDEPLQLRLMDHDTYSANDAIGKVVISLSPLLAREASNAKGGVVPPGGAVMSGWIPVFDTMHGIRGELNVIVKVELFSDFNKYKTSSCGVQFFHCPMIPAGYRAAAIHGFVEELVVNDDPEYQWIDKIRTPRASNEARQVAFIKLSNQVQRLVGLKAAELGANAVVGYQQDFDLEGEAGVVARAIGTAVSITPLPTPSQPLNMPPCSQQQLKKYLDILANDDENVTDLNQYYQTHQEELQKLLTILNPKTPSLLDETDAIDEEEKTPDVTRNSSVTSYTGTVVYPDDYASQKSLRHLSEDQIDLYKLLNKKDDEDSDSSGPLQKIKKLKANFFTKKFSSMRSKKSDKQDDQISIKSTSSDASRLSIDIRNEFKKLKRLKKPILKKVVINKEDEGVGMASILARSVIHAHTNLTCIAESQDSEHSPGSTLRRTSESEPTLNLSDDEISTEKLTESKDSDKKTPDIHFNSLNDIKSDDNATAGKERVRKISESCPTTPMVARSDNLLKLPGDPGYFDSVSSALSGESSEIYSSSSSADEDDESSDIRTDNEKSYETTSSIVQSIMSHTVDPVLIAQMDRKLSVLDNINPEIHIVSAQREEDQDNIEINEANENEDERVKEVQKEIEDIKENEEPPTATATEDPETCVKKPNSHYIKIHNPFAQKKPTMSVSAPSSPVEKHSFVYRSSKRIKRQLSKLSKNSMIKSISQYSLLPKKKHETKNLSRPCSSSHIPKTPSDTVLGSPFFSYADLLSLDSKRLDENRVFHKSDEFSKHKVSMYIGSEPVSRASFSGSLFPYLGDHSHDHKKPALKPTGLVHTAMETILIDKVQSLLLPTSPEPDTAKNKQFFNDVSEKLGQVEEDRNKSHGTTSSSNISKEYSSGSDAESMQVKPHFTALDKPAHETRSKRHESSGLIHTAVETILFDKVQSLMGPSTPEPKMDPTHNEEEHAHKHKRGSSGSMKSIIMDKVHSFLGPKSPDHDHKDKHFDTQSTKSRSHKSSLSDDSASGLVRTAMQTILMDKVQSLMGPSTPEPEAKSIFDIEPKAVCKDQGSSGLVHTAMETILYDKVQSLLGPKTPDPNTEAIVDESPEEKSTDKESSGLVHTAMETMLFDKVQSLLGPKTPDPIIEPFVDEQRGGQSTDRESTGLVHSAMETILFDKVQSLLGPKTPELDTSKNNDVKNGVNDDKASGNVEETSGIVHIEEVYPLVRSKTSDINNPSDLKNKELLDTIENPQPGNSMLVKQTESLQAPENVQVEHNIQTVNKSNSTVRIVGEIPKIKKDKKLMRQDSVHSTTETEDESKMSKEANIVTPCKATKKTPVLQHFHPILSGAPLETIPSLPESSLDHTESLDTDGVEDTNKASVCDNSHAACRFDRSEREKKKEEEKEKGSPRHARHESYGGREPVPTLGSSHVQNSSLNASSTPMGIHRRSSDSDLSVTPKGSSLNTSAVNVGSGGGAILKPSMNTNNLDMLEYPFLTITDCPPGLIVHIGGTVCARSVKLVDGGGESAVRAAWWAELRTELRAHARALRCNAVLAYTDTANICEDVCVLSASGTAVVINLDCDFNADIDLLGASSGSRHTIEEPEVESCSISHVPYSPGSGPYRAELATCGGCRRARVPTVMLATCAKPNRLHSYAKALTITAVAARVRRAPPAGEPGARDISDQLPFLEYELHKLLLAKLRMQGANAIFSLQTQIAIGERCVMALASGTAYRLTALPPPTPPRIKASESDKNALDIQKALWDAFNANRITNGYDIGGPEHTANGVLPEVDDEAPVLDLCADKDACVLELDEAEDVETARWLATRCVHMQVFTTALQPAIGVPPHAFTQVWRGRLGTAGGAAARHVSRALDGVAYKLRRLAPAALLAPRFHIQLPDDEIQLVVSGAAIQLQDPSKVDVNGGESGHRSHGNGHGDADDDIFTLDEEQLVKSPSEPVEEKCEQVPTTVSLTSLSYVSGARRVRRVCALRLLFVRETTAVRELGGLSGFLHTFTCEVLAIARASTAALGGNALSSFYITQLMLQDNAHKNQGQCLLSVGGDVIHITY